MRPNTSYVRKFLQMTRVSMEDSVTSTAKIWPGYTALHFAVANYRYETYKLLLEYSANYDSRTWKNLTLLHLVCIMGDDELDMILNEAIPTDTSYSEEERISQFFVKFRLTLNNRYCLFAELLIFCEIDASDDDGNLALMYVISNNSNLRFINSLLSDKLKIRYEELSNIKGALHETQMFFIKHFFTFYMSAADFDGARNAYGFQNIKQLNIQNKSGNTCLHNLTSLPYPKDDVATYLLQFGGDVSILNNEFASPLHLAVKNKQTFFVQCALNNSGTVWSRMVNVNAQDSLGNTPFHYAIAIDSDGKVNELLSLLLIHGADAEIKNNDGLTTLSFLYNQTFALIADVNFPLAVNLYENTVHPKYKPEVETAVNDRSLEQLKLVDVTFAASVWKYLEMLRLCYAGDKRLPDDFIDALSERLHVTTASICDREKFKIMCEKESDRIKETRFSGNDTLYDLLVKNIHKVTMEYTDNVLLRNILQSAEFKARFPVYGHMLKARFLRALIRKDLMERSREALHEAIESKLHLELPRKSTENILCYLSENDLRCVSMLFVGKFYD